MRLRTLAGLGIVLLIASGSWTAPLYIWGIAPTKDSPLIEIDPFMGTINRAYTVPGAISTSDTEIGLAGWTNAIFYTNANQNNGVIYQINPETGEEIGNYSVSGGWEIDGLGYYQSALGSWIYTSGCSVSDIHRYESLAGANPEFYWSDISDPKSMAGDNGGRIFTYGSVGSGAPYYIYEIDPLNNTGATFFANSPSNSIVGMAYDGYYLYLSDTNNFLYTLSNSGSLVNTLNLGYTLYALASVEGKGTSEIPEPGTILLLGTGLVGLAGWRRKGK